MGPTYSDVQHDHLSSPYNNINGYNYNTPANESGFTAYDISSTASQALYHVNMRASACAYSEVSNGIALGQIISPATM
jgi:hypothetical protein